MAPPHPSAPSRDASRRQAVASARRARAGSRASQLSPGSRFLYRIDHYSSLPSAAIAVTVLVIGALVTGAVVGFRPTWATAFSVATSAVTLVMVFSIQHTQGREQAATQRKLDELLRALPGTEESLILLEEAPEDVLREVEDQQRDRRAAVADGGPRTF